MAERLRGQWHRGGAGDPQTVAPRLYRCAYCGERLASERGWQMQEGNSSAGELRICPVCNRPTFFEVPDGQYPGAPVGAEVGSVPSDEKALYDEARRCYAAGAHTAAVLVTRKLLMHVAVSKGAKPGKSFVEYVDYLSSNGYIGKDSKGWVDAIRTRGNEANHEIVLMDKMQSKELIDFAEMLLKIVYEYPARAPQAPAPTP